MARAEYAPEDPDGEVGAFQPTPTGAIIRSRGVKRDGEWVNVIEVVDADGEHVVELLASRKGLPLSSIFNYLIQPFIDGKADEVQVDSAALGGHDE